MVTQLCDCCQFLGCTVWLLEGLVVKKEGTELYIITDILYCSLREKPLSSVLSQAMYAWYWWPDKVEVTELKTEVHLLQHTAGQNRKLYKCCPLLFCIAECNLHGWVWHTRHIIMPLVLIFFSELLCDEMCIVFCICFIVRIQSVSVHT